MTRTERDRNIGHWAFRIAFTFRTLLEERLEELDLRSMEAFLLALLDREGPMNLSQMARRMDYAHPSVLRHLEAMEQKQLIRREPHPSDRRVKLAALTDRARGLLPRMYRIMDQVSAIAVEDLAPGEEERLIHLMRTVLESLSRGGGTDPEDHMNVTRGHPGEEAAG